MQTFTIRTDQYIIEKSPAILKTRGIGSCVSVLLYNVEKKIGALAHISLSENNSQNETNTLGIQDTINAILIEMDSMNCHRVFTRATLVGGANMFDFKPNEISDIGNINIIKAREVLFKYNIPIVKEDVLGNTGRSLVFNLKTGKSRISNYTN